MKPAPARPATEASGALRVLVLTVLVTAILLFDPRDGRPGGRPKYLVVVAGAGAAAALLAAAGRRGAWWRDNPLRRPVTALVVCAALATLASGHRRTALFGFAGSYDGLLAWVSFAVLFAATAATFSRKSLLSAIRVLWFGAGTGVLVFGLAQLADRLISPNAGWDWARPEISPWTIGSTLGNPNHLGGLLAILLPLAAVLALSTSGRERTLVVAGIALAVAELGITASRGAWAAVVAAALLLAWLFRAELRSHRQRTAVMGGGAVVVLAVVLVALAPTGATKLELGDLARVGPGSTLDLRFELWATAWRVTVDHPVLGVGPDVFPVVFPAYETERFVRLFGPFTIANGAHNVFLNTLANLGVAGLAAFVALLAAAAVATSRVWGGLDHGARLLAGGLAASVLAYLVQACVNTQTIAITLCFWVLLGLLVALISRPGHPDATSR